MSSIRKRPNGVWRARYRDSAGKEHSRHFDRKIDGQQWLNEVTASVVTGMYVDPHAGKVTFNQWWAQWVGRQVWAQGTIDAARQAADSVPFGDLPMSALRRSHVEQWVKEMTQKAPSRQAGLAASTIRTRYNYVHMALRAAVGDRVIQVDPSDKVTLPRVRRAEASMTIPEAVDVGRAMRAADPQFASFIAVCAFAGLRIGEASGLQVADINFLRRTLTVRRQIQGQTNATSAEVDPKAGSERVVFIPEALTHVLSAHIEHVGVRGDEQWLFWAPGGHYMNRNSVSHRWRQVREEVGLGEFTMHDLRHFYASGLIAAGCDVVTVQRSLGHSSPSITLDIYSHLWPSAEDKTRDAAKGLMESAMTIPADSLRTATS